ncbi:hypothetical protein GCM10009677_12530 [Sphaerisporangium rubeum]|uniref:Ricin B lectin domain-containing protein n=1 Tax=Sphaerisporangium rubeum TaxID=321317 RepID=A0A7X0IIP7_9ACTN|nr:RICIN domain-containing protein [Sphaerisporangium rubeum]MBB6474417.1 hypothetical protein [Sphaerisporangium rubeum]
MRVFKKVMAVGALVVAGLLAGTGGQAQAAAGSFTVRLLPSSNRFIFMDVQQGSTGDGAPIIVWPLSGDNQVWTFEPVGTNLYMIRNKHSNKCIQTSGVAGDQLVQWNCHNRPNQLWSTGLSPLPFVPSAIVNPATGLVMDVSGGGGQGSAVIGWPSNGGLNQSWFTAAA